MIGHSAHKIPGIQHSKWRCEVCTPQTWGKFTNKPVSSIYQ